MDEQSSESRHHLEEGVLVSLNSNPQIMGIVGSELGGGGNYVDWMVQDSSLMPQPYVSPHEVTVIQGDAQTLSKLILSSQNQKTSLYQELERPSHSATGNRKRCCKEGCGTLCINSRSIKV